MPVWPFPCVDDEAGVAIVGCCGVVDGRKRWHGGAVEFYSIGDFISDFRIRYSIMLTEERQELLLEGNGINAKSGRSIRDRVRDKLKVTSSGASDLRRRHS